MNRVKTIKKPVRRGGTQIILFKMIESGNEPKQARYVPSYRPKPRLLKSAMRNPPINPEAALGRVSRNDTYQTKLHPVLITQH